jgi:hypothetical protein
MVKASGIVFNINKFAFLKLVMMQSGPDAFAGAVVAGQQISTTHSMDVESTPSAADGSFTVNVPANSTFYMVARENNEFVRTQTVIPVTATNVDLQVPPVIACPTTAETTILATGAGLAVEDLETRGYSVFQTSSPPAPPVDVPVANTNVSIAESADFDVYEFEGNHAGGVDAKKGNASPLGLYGIVPKTAVSTHRDIHLTFTDPNGIHMFSPTTLPIDGGFFSSALALANN